MTPQEILDFGYKAVMDQGLPSVSPSRACLYRGPAGRKCFVGHFIPDDKYTSGTEGTNLEDVISLCPDLSTDQRSFIADCQRAHDRAAFVHPAARTDPTIFREIFTSHIKAVAIDHNLKMPVWS